MWNSPWARWCQRNVDARRVHLSIVARRGEFPDSAVEASKRGKRQPNLAAFITLAWSLHEEPRELFDKLLSTMRLPPGTRPVLNR